MDFHPCPPLWDFDVIDSLERGIVREVYSHDLDAWLRFGIDVTIMILPEDTPFRDRKARIADVFAFMMEWGCPPVAR